MLLEKAMAVEIGSLCSDNRAQQLGGACRSRITDVFEYSSWECVKLDVDVRRTTELLQLCFVLGVL
jgi:hypothetical protein